MENRNKTALITGASRGFGLAMARALAKDNWNLIITARNSAQLLKAKQELQQNTIVQAVAGDVRDEVHLLEIAQVLKREQIQLALVVNNASALGPSPLEPILEHPVDELHTVLHTNVIAPLSLLQKLQPFLERHATIVNLSSDAATNAYETWGGYGSSKAALDHITTILAIENPGYHFYAFDPGDMRTDMHQEAFPGEDISDRPTPEEHAVPALIELLNQKLKSGRYTVETLKTQFA